MEINTTANLLIAKIELLKLKADDYNWQCHTPDDIKAQIEDTLKRIDEFLKPPLQGE